MLRHHLLAVKIKCGFDNNFFKLLKKKFVNKTENQKKVVLVFDDMSLRENISVNFRNLTYMVWKIMEMSSILKEQIKIHSRFI